MKTFLTQLFCRHIYKTTGEDYLRTTREGTPVVGFTLWSDYTYMAEYQKCLKCEKERIVEKRYSA